MREVLINDQVFIVYTFENLQHHLCQGETMELERPSDFPMNRKVRP